MTVTCNCKKKMIKISPAAVHVDNTARPQLINKKDNFKVYDILNKYYRYPYASDVSVHSPLMFFSTELH